MSNLLKFNSATKLFQQNTTKLNQPKQPIWGYVAIAFNKVDTDRRSKVGPDRLCAEWIIKNGGAIRTIEAPNVLYKKYNSLPVETTTMHLKVIDATEASIMKIGLEHFNGCNFIDKVILHKCEHLEEDGLEGLTYLRNSLLDLQVSACYNIADEGLKIIGELKRLRTLKIFDMMYVKNMEAVAGYLHSQLPDCTITARKRK